MDKPMDVESQDPHVLLSMINTKLRDFYKTLDVMCEDMHVDASTLQAKLSSAGYEYNKEQNQFKHREAQNQNSAAEKTN